MPSKYILAYSKIFNCTIDYLFGLTNAKSINHDIRFLMDDFGYSEMAVVTIEKGMGVSDSEEMLPQGTFTNFRSILDKVLSSRKFSSLIFLMSILDALVNKSSNSRDMFDIYGQKLCLLLSGFGMTEEETTGFVKRTQELIDESRSITAKNVRISMEDKFRELINELYPSLYALTNTINSFDLDKIIDDFATLMQFTEDDFK